MPTVSTSRARANRKTAFADYDGVETFVKHTDDVSRYVFRLAEDLDFPSEQISALTVTADGPTVNSSGLEVDIKNAAGEVIDVSTDEKTVQTAFYFRIIALDSSGNQLGYSDEVSATLWNDEAVILTWDAFKGSGDVTDYRVYRGFSSNTYTAYLIDTGALTHTMAFADSKTAATNPSLTSSAVFLVLTKTGDVKLTLTTSDSHTLVKNYRFVASERPPIRDYR